MSNHPENPDSLVTKLAAEWLRTNDWDYQKYGDRRGDRSAYESLMNYEISDELVTAFEAGYAACQKERDELQAKLAEYAPVREFYGPAGQKHVSEIIKERDRCREALQQIASWCQTPSNPDDCRIAECYVARKALKEQK